ncbi:hypothetical protein L0337_27365 [candidate division KSB1 bacterium]|nr:hypothetical protein [candidate division KSB1 bacterium]
MNTEDTNDITLTAQEQPVQSITPSEFEEAFGEPLSRTLNLDTWMVGENLPELYARLEAEVRDAVADEDRIRQEIRSVVFPKIATGRRRAPNAGLHQVNVATLEKAHRGLLFNGGVEACDGTNVVHDTLPLSITQIGVCLVSYHGELGTWVHRLFRRDLRLRGDDPVQEALEMLERRKSRDGTQDGGRRDQLSELSRRSIMTYAERAILLEKSNARWRMGHGHPTPYELLTGYWAHNPDMVQASLSLMRRLVLDHQRFVFVPSAPSRRHLLTLGNALKPLEYLILFTIEDDLVNMVEHGGYRGKARQQMEDFTREVGPKVVTGLYRVSKVSPPYLFYAHADHAQTAALIAMADSTLQEHRGFPMLIDIADTVCRSTFSVEGFLSSVQLAYADTGQPLRYLSERETRR